MSIARLVVVSGLLSSTGCFATLGFGVTKPTSGDIERGLVPSAEVGVGFA